MLTLDFLHLRLSPILISNKATRSLALLHYFMNKQPYYSPFLLNMKADLSTLQEFPCVRYRAPKGDASATTKFDMVPKWLATAVWDIVSKYKSTIPEFPQKETCELLIVDRPIDQVLKHNLLFILKVQ